MKLYYVPGACSLAVHIALEWSGINYEVEVVDFASPGLKDIYPGETKVPILDLQDGSVPLTQTPAILKYLASKFPQANMICADSLEQIADTDRWLSFLGADLHPSCHPLFLPDRYTTGASEEDLNKVKGAATKLVRKELAILENHLNNKQAIVGENLSIADAYFFPMSGWMFRILEDGLDAYPNISALRAKLLANKGVVKAMQDEGLQ